MTIKRRLLLADGDDDLANIKSNKQRDRLIRQMVSACSRFVESDLQLKLTEIFESYLKDSDEQWEVLIDEQDRDRQTLLFNYPRAVELVSGFYVEPSVKLEFGCRSKPWPTMSAKIKPFAAEQFPDVFSDKKDCEVIALRAERTFWEKATILHQEANRSKDRPFPLRFSRHYYDLAMLAKSPYFLTPVLLKIPPLLKRSPYIAPYLEAGKIFMLEDGKAHGVERPATGLSFHWL